MGTTPTARRTSAAIALAGDMDRERSMRESVANRIGDDRLFGMRALCSARCRMLIVFQ